MLWASSQVLRGQVGRSHDASEVRGSLGPPSGGFVHCRERLLVPGCCAFTRLLCGQVLSVQLCGLRTGCTGNSSAAQAQGALNRLWLRNGLGDGPRSVALGLSSQCGKDSAHTQSPASLLASSSLHIRFLTLRWQRSEWLPRGDMASAVAGAASTHRQTREHRLS